MTSPSKHFDDARNKLEERLTRARSFHSISTSVTAEKLAADYGENREYALMAGLLHDWDKAFPNTEILERAKVYDIQLEGDVKALLPVLHAQTGACAVALEYPDLPLEIIQSISRHALAATDMSPLDMIIYVADKIEPLRTAEGMVSLRSLSGVIPLEELFSACYRENIAHLIQKQRHLHPVSTAIWNTYVAK